MVVVIIVGDEAGFIQHTSLYVLCGVLAEWCWTEEPRCSLPETSFAKRPGLHR